MTPDEILRQLQHLPDHCDFAPYEAALRAAAIQREATTPELITAIDRVSANPAHYLESQEDCLHLFAICLLAQFRERRAVDAFLRFFSLPGEQALDLIGDLVTEKGAAVLASVCGGDPAPLLRLTRDEAVNEFVREQAIAGLLVQCAWGERPREAVIADLRRLFSTLAKPGHCYVWAGLAGAVHDFNARELLPEVRQAYAEDLVDDSVIGLADIDRDAPRPPRGYAPPSPEQRYQWFCERNAPIDAVNECAAWLCFRKQSGVAEPPNEDTPGEGPYRREQASVPPPDKSPESAPPRSYIAPPKIGRNEPCPCGSGKKYKKCCGK